MNRRTLLCTPAALIIIIMALLGTAKVRAQPAAPLLRGETCSLDGLLEQIRKGMSGKSEAYRRYLRNLLRESAVNLPAPKLAATGDEDGGRRRRRRS